MGQIHYPSNELNQLDQQHKSNQFKLQTVPQVDHTAAPYIFNQTDITVTAISSHPHSVMINFLTTNIPVTSKPIAISQPGSVNIFNEALTTLIMSSVTADSIAELTKQFSQLALLIQGCMQSPRVNANPLSN